MSQKPVWGAVVQMRGVIQDHEPMRGQPETQSIVTQITYRQKAEISVFRALGQLYYVAMCWKLSFITKLFEKTMNSTLIVHICLCPCSWSFPLGVSTPPFRFFTISRLRIYDFAPKNMLNTQLYRPVVIYGNIWEQKFLHRCSSI